MHLDNKVVAVVEIDPLLHLECCNKWKKMINMEKSHLGLQLMVIFKWSVRKIFGMKLVQIVRKKFLKKVKVGDVKTVINSFLKVKLVTLLIANLSMVQVKYGVQLLNLKVKISSEWKLLNLNKFNKLMKDYFHRLSEIPNIKNVNIQLWQNGKLTIKENSK